MATTPDPTECLTWIKQLTQLCEDVKVLIAAVHAVLNEVDETDDDEVDDMEDEDLHSDDDSGVPPAKRGHFPASN